MKVCLKCESPFESTDWICKYCGQEPLKQDGRLFFSPELSESCDGFSLDSFEKLFKIELTNFWFRSRNKLITWAISRYFLDAKNFFEIGCGTGFVLSAIEKEFPDLDLYGSEIYNEGLRFASTRVLKTTLFQMDARKIPFKEEFDVIGAFDILEHINEDEEVLEQIYQSLKPGGGIILTVPQHPFLWSIYDEHSYHVRRYQASELKQKVQKAGFKVKKVISFVSILFPILVINRLQNRKSRMRYDVMSEFRMSKVTNAILERVLDLERFLIKAGITFPFGGSLLLIATKE